MRNYVRVSIFAIAVFLGVVAAATPASAAPTCTPSMWCSEGGWCMVLGPGCQIFGFTINPRDL
jgi:hypothetical protein